jgi:imidazole glycerol phosphate synthase glutamine amidotransferase subunit
MIAILDYGAGNLRSVQNTLGEIGAIYSLAHTAEELRAASKIILPGVGHFGQLIRSLDSMRVRGALLERITAGVPFLGICLGLQALFERSEEAPELDGLGVIPGIVKRFPQTLRVPHMGWNEIAPRRGSRLLAGIGPRPYLYFAHSFYGPVTDATAATCDYSETYTAALERDSLFGVQFHPEKSGPLGLRIVKNFVDL